MKTPVDREGNPSRRHPMSARMRLFILVLLALAIFSVFVYPPDSTNVLGYSSSAPSPKSIGACYYQVSPGDNLFRIGLRYGIPYQELAMMNGISNPDSIKAGSVLSVPCSANAQPHVPTQPCGSAQTYLVNHGDNLFRIALNYGSTVSLLRSSNNLYGRVLRAGMSLILPCAGTVAHAPSSPPSREHVGTPPSPAVNATPPAEGITPQVTPVVPGVGITPVVTVIATGAPTPSVSTQVNPANSPIGVPTPVAVTANTIISMRGNKFVQDAVQIRAGGRVTWINAESDGTMHTVTCAECPADFNFDSGSSPIGPGKSYSVLFKSPGVFFYYSRLQPSMIGMVIVNQ